MSKEICYQEFEVIIPVGILACPYCRRWVKVVAQNVHVTLEKESIKPIPDKPPEKGDWVLLDCVAGPVYVDGEFEYRAHKFHYKDKHAKVKCIVRRKDDPLQKGDQGFLDGKIECWVNDANSEGERITIVFDKSDMGGKYYEFDYADVMRSRFTLLEPVWKKGDG